MRWFGMPCGAPYEADTPRAEVPEGVRCTWCDEPITARDAGFLVPLYDPAQATHRELAYHHECHMRQIVGGVNHILQRCTCCGGKLPPDPPELTRREGAMRAVAIFEVLRTVRLINGEPE